MKPLMALCSFLLAFACFVSVEATQVVEIDSQALLRCTFSSRHQNRIAIDGQRIKKVIYSESELVVCTDETSGQLFIRTHFNSPSITTLSVITEAGSVQDVELTFVDRPSEILILKESLLEDSSYSSDICSFDCDDELDVMQHAIETLLAGAIPEEYVPVEDRQICYHLKSNVIAKSVMRLVGPLYTIYVMHIENHGKCQANIHESSINCIDGDWVFLEKQDIDKKEKILALIGIKTGIKNER